MDLIPSGIVKSFKLVQSANAKAPISVTVSGRSIVLRFVHSLKLAFDIILRLAGSLTSSSADTLLQKALGILVKESGKTTFFSFFFSFNASLSGSSVLPSSTITSVSRSSLLCRFASVTIEIGNSAVITLSQPNKANSLASFTVPGIFISVTFVHMRNADISIFSTVSGIIIFFRLEQ